jgi:predicted house-cleaning noncanonical NTP pyrophosphatase (MazG superfamily)
MKQIILFLLIIASCNLFAQNQDSIFNLKVEYKYEKVGNFHYFVSTSTNADSSVTVNRSAPFKTKKAVVDFAKSEIDKVDSLVQNLNEEIQRKDEYLKQLQEQAVLIVKNINEAMTKTRQELRTLRTQRKLTNDGKTLLKEVK